MGIRFNCPNGHKLNVKEFLAGKRGVCPQCGVKFIIPTPAETPVAEATFSVGIGMPQSIEIAIAPAQPVATTTPAPSTVIPVAELELELAPPELLLSPELEVPPPLSSDALPASILPVQPTPAVVPPVVDSATSARSSQRERGRRNQVLISVMLLILVLVLAGVLAWVLKREASRANEEKEKTTTSFTPATKPGIALNSIEPIRSTPFVGAPLS